MVAAIDRESRHRLAQEALVEERRIWRDRYLESKVRDSRHPDGAKPRATLAAVARFKAELAARMATYK